MCNHYKLILLLCVFLLSVSCKQAKVKDEWNGKEIVFPDALLQLKDGNHYPITSLPQKLKGKKKIVSIIDANCRKCVIGQLNRVDSLLRPLLESKRVELIFVLNVNPADSLYFMTRMYSEVKSGGKLLWDNAYHFETDNNIFTEDASRRTFLLNEKNEIILVGNPLYESKLLKEFTELLK